MRITRKFFLLCLFVAGAGGLFPALPEGWAQDSSSGSVMGLRQGEQDTMRMDLRVKGSEEKDIESSIRDQKIGAAHKTIRAERKETELLRAEEEAAERAKKTARTEEIQLRIEKKKREHERIRRKKTKVFNSSN